jgi:hypothetical protein
MSINRKSGTDQPRPKSEREMAHDHPPKRRDYVAGANGDQDIDASAADTDDGTPPQKPEKDGTGW